MAELQLHILFFNIKINGKDHVKNKLNFNPCDNYLSTHRRKIWR